MEEKIFKENEIYMLPNLDNIFLCERIGSIGKLVLYNKISKQVYERTTIQYFLNIYKENDLKELLLNRENYELIGKINNNYTISEDKKFLFKGEN